jgi:hypothetical protein
MLKLLSVDQLTERTRTATTSKVDGDKLRIGTWRRLNNDGPQCFVNSELILGALASEEAGRDALNSPTSTHRPAESPTSHAASRFVAQP